MQELHAQFAVFGLTGGESGAMDSQPGNKAPLRVLLAEDNPADVLLIEEALHTRFEEIEISVQSDGERMVDMIEALGNFEAPWPDIILMDLNLPQITGGEALERLRSSPLRGGVPVVVVSSSDAPQDRLHAARFGANHYFRKPSSYDEFMKLGEVVASVLYSPWA